MESHTLRAMGYLVNGDTVLCRKCHLFHRFSVPIYHGNIYPYNQDCAICHVCIVQGQNESWPVLFTGVIEHEQMELPL